MNILWAVLGIWGLGALIAFAFIFYSRLNQADEDSYDGGWKTLLLVVCDLICCILWPFIVAPQVLHLFSLLFVRWLKKIRNRFSA